MAESSPPLSPIATHVPGGGRSDWSDEVITHAVYSPGGTGGIPIRTCRPALFAHISGVAVEDSRIMRAGVTEATRPCGATRDVRHEPATGTHRQAGAGLTHCLRSTRVCVAPRA